ASNHQLGAEHLFRASLRAYQESRNNYFEDLEEAVDEFNRNYGHTDNSYSYEQLVSIVKQLYHCHIDEHSLDKEAELQNYRSVLLPKTRPVLLLNSKLTTAQKRFILAREIGYHFLGLQVRALTSSPEKVESFEQVFNDFKASYFAGALLLNRQRLIDELRNFFLLPHWDYKAVLEMIDRHNVTPEMLFYRWSELIPRFFNLKLHFLRYNEKHGQIRLIKQLNISQISVSGGLAMDEHHCRRWLVVRLLRQLEKQAKRALLGRSKRQVFVGTQISNFIEGGGRFFCIGISNPFTFNTGVKSSVAIGLKFDQKLEKAVHFLQDRSIPRLEVGTSCERCPLTAEDCIERAAEPRILVQIQKQRERERALHRLMVHNPID
ncbi:MAG: ImmA/IrrE family metallo-endopeptidase, partial [Blastocatellia bacterium]|nr:ImmA/IrrE family metallo-endopeptidase [Blastocatellia bacterium]